MSEKEANDETQEVVKWVEGDQTHGARGIDVKGLEGCIRVKGCRELGGIEVGIFETDVAFPNRAGKGKWTVYVLGMGPSGPKTETKTRKEAMKAHLEARQRVDIRRDLIAKLRPSDGPFEAGQYLVLGS